LEFLATQEIDRANQNQKDEWRRFAPPLIFWFYVLSKTYIAIETPKLLFFQSSQRLD